MKACRRWLSLAAGGFLICFLTAIPMLAAEASQQDPAESPAGVAFRWLNFFFVFGGAAYLIARYGGSFFRENAKAIAASIIEATAVKAQAERELSEVNGKVSRLDQEVAELRESARQDGVAETERLRLSGLAEIEKIKQAARGELVAAERAAQSRLRDMAASMAVERAGALVNSRMNPELRAKLFHSFLDEIARSSN